MTENSWVCGDITCTTSPAPEPGVEKGNGQGGKQEWPGWRRGMARVEKENVQVWRRGDVQGGEGECLCPQQEKCLGLVWDPGTHPGVTGRRSPFHQGAPESLCCVCSLRRSPNLSENYGGSPWLHCSPGLKALQWGG